MNKLFRAIVVMGVSITASGCDDSKCHHCSPLPADGATSDTKVADAGVDAPPGDATADAVFIL